MENRKEKVGGKKLEENKKNEFKLNKLILYDYSYLFYFFSLFDAMPITQHLPLTHDGLVLFQTSS